MKKIVSIKNEEMRYAHALLHHVILDISIRVRICRKLYAAVGAVAVTGRFRSCCPRRKISRTRRTS